MGGGRTQPDPPVNWQSDPTLNFTGDSGPVPPGVGKGCFIAPQLTLGTPLDPQRILACAPGFYCANLNQSQAHTLPVSCPASPGCIAYRLTGFPCSAQGLYEPIICKPGYYCPTFSTMFKCPAGYFCPTGTVTPHRCNFLSSCPKGSTYETVYLWLIIIGIIDGVLIVIWAAYTLKRFQLASVCFRPTKTMKRLRHLSRSTTPRSNDALEPNDLPLTTISRRSAIPIEEPNTENLRHDLTLLKDAFQAAFPLHGQVRVNFRFEGLELVLRDGRRVLGGVTGKIREGRMTAIIGPSGAGKTTFMNVLMGKVSKTGGKIFINGRESQMHLYRKVIGYVPQEDVMMKELTVRENVLHSARVRLPRTWTSTQIERHVDNVVNALKLSHVASSVIGDEAERGVSGGQRKRVNIGMELAAAPLAIFLDEPTSGLDSSSALEVADILSSMALLGITIVAVVHQPRIEIFRKFDDVIMVAPGGRVAFMGPVDRVQGYFESLGFKFEDATNVSDVAMDILAGRGTNAIVGPLTPDQVVELWENGILRRNFILRVASEKAKHTASSSSIRPSYMSSFGLEAFVAGYEGIPDERSGFVGPSGRLSSDKPTIPTALLTRDFESGPYHDLYTMSRNSGNNQSEDPASSVGEYPVLRSTSWSVGSRWEEPDTFGLLESDETSMPRTQISQIRRLDSPAALEDSLNRYQKYVHPFNASPLRRLHPKKPASRLASEEPAVHIMDRDVASLMGGISSNYPASVGHSTLSAGASAIRGAAVQQSEYSSGHAGSSSFTYEYDTYLEDGTNTSEVSFTKSYVTLRRHSQNQEFHRVMPGVVKERGASFFRQVMYCHNRSLVQQGRRVNALILEIVVAVFAGVLMGISTQGKVKELYTGFYTGIYKAISPRSTDVVSLYCFLVGLAIALASAPSGVKVFGEEKHVYWREAASGHSRLAYFLGKTFATLFRIIITSLHFTAFYMILAKPIISPYMQYYVIALQYWGVYGLSCIISMVVKRENASLLAVVMCLFASVFCGYGPSITQAKAWHLNWIMDLSFNKWAAEAMYASSVNIYKSIYDVELAVSQFGWSLNQVPKDLICCFLIGLIARVAAFFLLIFLHRDKQR